MNGERRDEPVQYIARDPGEPGSNGEVYLEQPPCPLCKRGFLVREFTHEGRAEMMTCTNGCGQRYYYER